MTLFITCPVADVTRATAFYTAIGWTLNAEMSDDKRLVLRHLPDQYVMLGSREMYASVGREEVDALIERAKAAGARIGDTDDYPFMYQRQFDDLDGYHYSPFWMKPDADQAS